MKVCICKNQFLREGLQTLGTSIKRLLRSYVSRARKILRKSRPDLSDTIVNRLLFSYFCDLSHIDETFDERVLVGAIRDLPGSIRVTPPGTRIFTDLELVTLESDLRIPLDLVVLLSLAQLPRHFNSWCLYDPSIDRCARRFGELSDIDKSHRDMTLLLVFTHPDKFLQTMLKLAFSRIKRNASTWLFHTESINLDIPDLETNTVSFAGIYVTVLRPISPKLKVLNSGLPRAEKGFEILNQFPPTLFALPFLGFGKLSRIIIIKDLPTSLQHLFEEQKLNFAPDFMLGFFKPLFKDQFNKKSRSFLRHDLLKLALPILKFSHNVRLHYYSYLRSGFNIFPRPLVKHRTFKRTHDNSLTNDKAKRKKLN